MIGMITPESFSELLGILGDKEKCIESDEFILYRKKDLKCVGRRRLSSVICRLSSVVDLLSSHVSTLVHRISNVTLRSIH